MTVIGINHELALPTVLCTVHSYNWEEFAPLAIYKISYQLKFLVVCLHPDMMTFQQLDV